MAHPTEKELVQQGWEKRFSVEEHRAPEYKENYESLGYEVLILPTPQVEVDKPCDECIQASTCTIVTIFTRLKQTN